MPDLLNSKKSQVQASLLQITKSIIATLNLDEVLQIISDGMSELLNIETAAIYLLEKDDKLYLGATTPALNPDFPESLRVASIIDHPFILRAALSKQAVVIDDTDKVELSVSEKRVVEMRNLKSLLFLPFIHDEMVLGVLILGTCNITRVFTEYDVEFGQTIANQLAIGIENTRLHADIKHHKEHLEQLVKEKTANLDTAMTELQIVNEKLKFKNEELEKALKSLKEAEAQLIQSEKMASLGVLTAGVAHEINNPLNYIMGAYRGFENYFKRNSIDDPKLNMLMKSLHVGLENATNIVKGLNQFSRETEDFIEDCDLKLIMDNCLVMLNNQLKNHIKIHKEFPNEPVVVRGNSGKLHQVFLNLIINAAQAVQKEGSIHLNIYKQENNYRIEVGDDGIGISPENLSRIMDPFYTTKEPGEGTGLGLYIVYSILKEHNGSIAFRSEVGKGTLVKITLPV